jgi:hypothetical protein
MLNVGYGSVKKMLAYRCEQAGAHVREGEVTFPLSGPDGILTVVRNTLRPNTHLAIFDHITSNTGACIIIIITSLPCAQEVLTLALCTHVYVNARIRTPAADQGADRAVSQPRGAGLH